jgi:hypothetical protein
MEAKKTAKLLGKIALWILGIWMGLLILVQIILSPAVLTRIINSLAGDYIDADVSFGKASVSVFSHFPKITLNLEDVEITYPHDRFDSLEQRSMQGALLYKGCGEVADTLASLRRMSASVSLLPLLTGNIKLPDIEIESPKVFAHYYDENHANWNIFGASEASSDSSADTADSTAPQSSESEEESMNIIVKKIRITGRPQIVYTDSQDSLYALITTKSMSFDGNFETNALHKTLADARIDSLFIAGRYGKDTLAVGLDRLSLKERKHHMNMQINAKTFMATEAFGRMMVPIEFRSDISIPEDPGIAVSLKNIAADIATIPASGNLDIKMREDRILTEGKIDITQCKIETILHKYLAQFIPELSQVRTDTEVSATVTISGYYGYDNGVMPEVKVDISVPDSKIDYSTFPEKIYLGMNAKFQMDTTGVMNTDITKARIHTYGLQLDARGQMHDMTADDPEIGLHGNMRASLDSLRRFLPDSLNMTASGSLEAVVDGTLRMSHMDIYQFSKAAIEGSITGSGIAIQMPDDTIDIKMDGLDIRLAPEQITSRRDPSRTFRLMGLTGKLAMADINYKDVMVFQGKDIDFGAKNSADEQQNEENVSYLGGRFNAEMMQLDDSEGTSIKLEKTKNSFQMRPKRGQPSIPVLALKNKNQRITYITTDNRVILTDSEISAEAAMNTIDRKRRREAYLDSLANIYPEVPRDSLFRHMRTLRTAQPMPSWMAEEDFKSSDIKVDLNETIKKYYREWDIKGNAGIRTGIIMTPYLPLRNILRGASLSLTNNRVAIDSLKMKAGESELCAKGSINGLRRVMLGNGNIQMDMDISSSSLNADELLKAYTIGSQYESDDTKPTEELTNAEFFKQVTTDTVRTAAASTASLFVIPGNINADITLNTSGIKYKDLNISSFTADMLIKERCAQLTGTSMRSNMGGFDLDAFYVTRSKEDIRAGFCLDVKDVTSERVIGLMPEIGEVIPMIGSIKGLLNCEIAATAALDTTMSIVMPSVNGILRMSGKDLSISDDEVYTSVAKMLMFRNKRKGQIDDLQIEGTIKDNTIEVFPFILKVDRYTLGLSGVQNMDMSYKHHVSVLRSPLLIRLGLNISGPDYDHMKFKLGKALYRAKKVPSFTAVIDQTKNDLRYSIYNIFETGIDNTLQKRDIQTLITQHQNSIGYTNAADMEMEELSEEEMGKLENSESAESVIEEAMAAAVIAVQEVLGNK